ncbi:MAG: flagellar assembly peptidoglycan hydrolase FlgJ [Rhodocyclales bacterium]|nr:flagellar assembly peptidoglycan hydrolase FlgJ [Rhodocyclales bacterium]
MNTSANASAVNPNVFDVGNLTALKRQMKDGDPKSLKAVAQQFEALFLQMVLKSMRDATPREGMFDSDQSRMYESLLDQQMAQVLGAKSGGTGLAAMIEKQLLKQTREPQALDGPLPLSPPTQFIPFTERGMIPLPAEKNQLPLPLPAAQPYPLPAVRGSLLSSPVVGTVSMEEGVNPSAPVREFVARLWPAAVEAGRATGIPAHFMVAQAALETGWGKSEPRRADGSTSFNVFGIKAGAQWRGPAVDATTTEVVAGVSQVRVERFRAYGSYEEAFHDYAKLLTGNPRYAAVLGAQEPARFARGVQAAGFATDPLYAAKLERIIGGTTLRQALAG